MAQEAQLVEFPFSAGYDDGTDPRATPKFLAVNNYRWLTRGRLERRYGYSLPSTQIYPAPTGVVETISVLTGGSGYTGNVVVVVGGSGSGAVATANLLGSSISTITVVSGGNGYPTVPTLVPVTFTNTTGSGATAVATCDTSGGGGNLSQSYTLQPLPITNILQTTDGTRVYAQCNNGWTPLTSNPGTGALGVSGGSGQYVTSINCTAVNGAARAQTALTTGSLPTNWLPTLCAGYLEWWNCGVTENYLTGAIQGSASRTGYVAAVTDGVRYAWGFQASGTTVTFDYFDYESYSFFEGLAFQTSTVNGWFDAYYAGSGTVVAMTASGLQLSVATYTWNPVSQSFSGASQHTTLIDVVHGGSSSVALQAISVAVGAAGNIYGGWSYEDTTNTKLVVGAALFGPVGGSASAVFSTSSSQSAGGLCGAIPTVAITEAANAPECVVAFTSNEYIGTANGSIDKTRTITYNPGGNGGGSGTGTVGISIAARPYVENGLPYLLGFDQQSASYVLMNVQDTGGYSNPANAVALINPRAAAPPLPASFATPGSFPPALFSNGHVPPTPVLAGRDTWLLPVSSCASLAVSNGLILQKLLVNHDGVVNAPVPEATALIYPAGVPTVAGPATTFAAQFMQPPTITSITVGGSGGTLSAGSYIWQATYVRQADDGSFVESTPSFPFALTLASAGQVASIYVTSYGLGNSAVTYINLYRTTANGTAIYRVYDPTTNVNLPGDAYTLITDGANGTLSGDAYIDQNEQLYTSGGVFANVCPSACTIAQRVRDRIWVAGTPDGSTVYYSDAISNVATTNFHDEQTLYIDRGGPVTGICAMDDKTIIFKRETIFVVYGTEGGPTGANNTLSIPAQIPSAGVGCIAQSSIVLIPDGIVFQSERGIELLDRSLNLTFVGDAVRNEIANLGTVTAAIWVQAQYHVRFIFGKSFGSTTAAVYSALSQEWSLFNYPAIDTVTDACIVNGAPFWAGAGTIYQETVGGWADAGAAISSSWRAGWIALGQLEGYRRYNRLQLLGQYNSGGSGGTSVQTQIFTDFSTNATQTTVLTNAQINAIPGFDQNRLQLETVPVIPKAEAVSVAVAESGAAQGIGWNALAFEVVGKTGRYRKVPAAARS